MGARDGLWKGLCLQSVTNTEKSWHNREFSPRSQSSSGRKCLKQCSQCDRHGNCPFHEIRS